VRTNRLRAQHEQALAAERARWAAETAKQRNRRASWPPAQAKHAARANRITKALDNAQPVSPERIESEEGKHTFANQHGLFEAEQVRDAETRRTRRSTKHSRPSSNNERAALDQLGRRGPAER
jgi:hypothetical protein